MRLQYVAVVAAAALIASGDGLQVVPNSAKSTMLRDPADTRYQPYVEGKTDRFLISEAKNETPMKAPTGYEFSTLQEEDNDILQQEDEYEDDSESSSSDGSGSNERFFGRKKKKKKKKKNKETPTPTPTPTLAANETATPSPAPTRKHRRRRRFIDWLKRRIDD